jgi:hypothetical protein
MRSVASIALTSVLAISIVALNAAGDQKHQSGTKSGPGQPPPKSQGKGVGAGASGGNFQDKGGVKDSTGNVAGKKALPIPNLLPKNPGATGKKPVPKYFDLIKNVGKNPNVSPGAQGAINTVLSGEFLSSTERQDLNNLVAGNPAKLGEEDLTAVQAALDYDALAKREERYIKLENATGERLTIWLHYETYDDERKLAWFPTKPVDPDKALRYVMEPDATVYLSEANQRIAAARARVWAESDSGHKWLAYRDRDLQLKPAEREEVREMGTRTLRLVGNDATDNQAAK